MDPHPAQHRPAPAPARAHAARAAPALALVPRELQGRDLSVVPIKHPRTGEPADFVVATKLYQVVQVKKPLRERRALFVEDAENVRIHDPNLHVLLPVNPLFILLPALFATPSLPLHLLLNIAAGDFAELPEEMAREALSKVCTIEEDHVRLDGPRLDAYLRELVARVAVPSSLQVRELEDHAAGAYREFVAVNFISSWLPPAPLAHLRSLYDFRELEAHAASVAAKKAEATALYTLKRSDPPAKRPQKRQKAAKPANNRSLLDMFRA